MADVVMDTIFSLKIVTKIHEVTPYDEHSNKFLTLTGLKFRWKMEVLLVGIKTGPATVLVKLVHS